MNAEAKSSPRRRLVLLTDAAVARELAGPEAPRMWTCLAVGSPYEAAAELLAGPAAVLVVDLRFLTRHHRLLDIARMTATEVLGTGPLPAGTSSDELSGLRLVGRNDLVREIAKLASPPVETGTPETPAVQTLLNPTDQYGGSHGDRPNGGNLTRHKMMSQDGQAPSEPIAAVSAPRTVLTSRELAALLGDEP